MQHRQRSEAQDFLTMLHDRGTLHQDVTVFAEQAEALSAYDAAERRFAEQAHIEVVLIGSDSLDTVRRTHANYFGGTAVADVAVGDHAVFLALREQVVQAPGDRFARVAPSLGGCRQGYADRCQSGIVGVVAHFSRAAARISTQLVTSLLASTVAMMVNGARL